MYKKKSPEIGLDVIAVLKGWMLSQHSLQGSVKKKNPDRLKSFFLFPQCSQHRQRTVTAHLVCEDILCAG